MQRYQVKLLPLPTPDYWDFPLPPCRTCLLTDDGSLKTGELAQFLTKTGWQVLVLTFPQSLFTSVSSLPAGVRRVVLQDLTEKHLQRQLTTIADTYGGISAFIHLHPVICQSEKALLKYVFLLAKHLKSFLDRASLQGRSCFFTVASLDGELGLGKTIDFSALTGGLFGLTKTLNLEWKNVFCRAIDLSPKLTSEQAAQAIINEFHDPNALMVEVGYSDRGRVSLICEPAPLRSAIK
ncbi:MAG: hypothetical protein HC847_21070 [Hydrococcus sp. RU_2_2]|nr:hypothetical protein [Hydrococcus sp. RU_2_2]NJP20346.1 hypothetical protein [Hydrococcus sp. CRU_1_1]